jgi:hypothetical protein
MPGSSKAGLTTGQARRLAWFIGLYAAGLIATAGLAYGVRFALRLAS